MKETTPVSYNPEISSLAGLWTYRIVRRIPHSSNGTAIAPARVVAQWISVRQDNPS